MSAEPAKPAEPLDHTPERLTPWHCATRRPAPAAPRRTTCHPASQPIIPGHQQLRRWRLLNSYFRRCWMGTLRRSRYAAPGQRGELRLRTSVRTSPIGMGTLSMNQRKTLSRSLAERTLRHLYSSNPRIPLRGKLPGHCSPSEVHNVKERQAPAQALADEALMKLPATKAACARAARIKNFTHHGKRGDPG